MYPQKFNPSEPGFEINSLKKMIEEFFGAKYFSQHVEKHNHPPNPIVLYGKVDNCNLYSTLYNLEYLLAMYVPLFC